MVARSAGIVLGRPVAGVEQLPVLAPVRHVDDDRVRPAEQHGPQPLGGLVVQDPLPPVAGHVLGDDHERDRLVLVRRPGGVEDVEVGEQRPDQRPVRRLDDHQRHARDLALQVVAQARRRLGVVGDVDGPDVVADRAGDVDRLDDGPVDARHRDDHALLAVGRRDDEVGAHRAARASSGAYWRWMNSIIATRIGMRMTTR